LLLPACGGAEDDGEIDSTYIALGDSISVGRGASDPSQGFVMQLGRRLGGTVEIINLAKSGDTTKELLDGDRLQQAIGEVQRRAADEIDGNDVNLITLTIGGNDLLDLFFPLVAGGRCTSVQDAINREECRNPLEKSILDYDSNLGAILTTLKGAPGVRIVLLTVYNSFSGVNQVVDRIVEMALEGLANTPFSSGLNDIIRDKAKTAGVILADVYPDFQGRADELIAEDNIHPNDAGHEVIADVVLAALEDS